MMLQIVDAYDESDVILTWFDSTPVEMDEPSLPRFTLIGISNRSCELKYKTGIISRDWHQDFLTWLQGTPFFCHFPVLSEFQECNGALNTTLSPVTLLDSSPACKVIKEEISHAMILLLSFM